ncbi:hypothetical protein ACIBCA_36775 [Kitasatospora sp. NPDC051170]|uniref:hypothetical protein n=1 Tax=Kitasatospora sp. NPDC051170 TaxID=3364056 RepID=UPI0037B22436
MAVDNKAVDTLTSITAIGLLTRLIRARDGEEMTVEKLTRSYIEGKDSLSEAMRTLVEAGLVVKFKIQRARSEDVEGPDGKVVRKRGGSWYTTFSVDSIPFTLEDVAAMTAEIRAQGGVKNLRVEPTRLDPDPERRSLPPVARRTKKKAPDTPAKAPDRPTAGKPHVGPTCDDAAENPVEEPRPTSPSPEVGRPTVGEGDAHNYGKTERKETDDEPSVRPSFSDRGAREAQSGQPDGRTDGGEVDQEQRQQTGGPVAGGGSAAPAAPVAPQQAPGWTSPGVELLMRIGVEHPELRLAGKPLADQGARVSGLLAAGWDRQMLKSMLSAKLPDKIEKSVGAIMSGWISAIPAEPPVTPAAREAAERQEQRQARPAVPAPRYHECDGRDGMCGRRVPVAGVLCDACSRPCSTEDCSGTAAAAGGRCQTCVTAEADARLPRCQDGCDRPAVLQGQCTRCRREAREAAEAEAAFASLLGQEGAPAPF